MLGVVALAQGEEDIHGVASATVHGAEHRRDELVDAERLLDERHKSRDAALVVVGAAEVGEDELLERVDLVLQSHEIRDGLVACRQQLATDKHSPLVRVVNVLERNVLLVLEQAVELWVVAVEAELGEQEGSVGADERAVALCSVAADSTSTCLQPSSLGEGFLEGLAGSATMPVTTSAWGALVRLLPD